MLVVLLLVRIRPNIGDSSRYRREIVAFLPYAAGPILFVGFAVVLGYWKYGSLSASVARLQGNSISVEKSLDFGSVESGIVVERALRVHNISDHSIRLIGGTSDCGCLTTKSMPLNVPAGESRELIILLKVPPQTTGRMTRWVELWTDCGEQEKVPIQIGCDVR